MLRNNPHHCERTGTEGRIISSATADKLNMIGPSISICVDDKVIVQYGDSLNCIDIKPKRKIQMKKQWMYLDGVIGHPYGSVFEAKGHDLVLACDSGDIKNEANDVSYAGRDNRHVDQFAANQKLKDDDIATMRADGFDGDTIIGKLVENSDTFRDKTVYAQQKYIQKKKKKHLLQFCILRPSTRLITDMYFKKGPSKICFLRTDSLAQMLCQANVRAYSRLLVLDTCMGLLTGAVMERMGGYGTLISLHMGQEPCMVAAEHYGFPKSFWDTVYFIPVRKLDLVRQDKSAKDAALICIRDCHGTGSIGRDAVEADHREAVQGIGNMEGSDENHNGMNPSNNEVVLDEEKSLESCDEPPFKKNKMCESGDAASDKQLLVQQKILEKEEKREKRLIMLENAIEIMREGNFDGLLMAGRVHLTPLMLQLLDFIAASRPVVIFSQYKEPLLDCYMKLRDAKHLANLKMTDTWWRHYQVLDARTHPEMQMSSCSGFLLSGITMHNSS